MRNKFCLTRHIMHLTIERALCAAGKCAALPGTLMTFGTIAAYVLNCVLVVMNKSIREKCVAI